ncbi:MAG: hypothetical protein H0V09_00405 [Gemmatimonadetes bacterium]|nr:hypothetical protein [Gemmatimonadota bacterium]
MTPPFPRAPARVAVVLLLGPLVLLATAGGPAHGQVRWENDFRLSYEYDDNVREDVADNLRARVARVAVKSDLVLADSGANRVSLAYQGGFKRYFDVSSDLDVAGQFIHEGEVAYRRVLRRNVLRLSGAAKHRVWQDESFFVNEDGFTRLSGGAAATHAFTPTFSGELALGLSGIDFEHVDEVFGYEAQSAGIDLTQRLGDGMQAHVTYGVEQRTYDGRGKLRGSDDVPSNIFAPDRPRQIDLAHEVGIGLSFLQPFGFQGRYRYHVNDSNSFGFGYTSHLVNLQLAQELPWRMFAQFYGAVELRKFRDPIRGLVGALDVEDTDNNVLIFRLLKELNGHADVEARYARYRNESINLNAFYTKNVYSLGFRFRP